MGATKKTPLKIRAQIEAFCRAGGSFVEAAEKFKMPIGTIRCLAHRGGWTKKVTEPKLRGLVAEAHRVAVETWAEKAEAHRQHMFDVATKALKSASVPAPRNWKDMETADKIARRAAGLDDEGGQKTLVNIGLLRADPAEIATVDTATVQQ